MRAVPTFLQVPGSLRIPLAPFSLGSVTWGSRYPSLLCFLPLPASTRGPRAFLYSGSPLIFLHASPREQKIFSPSALLLRLVILLRVMRGEKICFLPLLQPHLSSQYFPFHGVFFSLFLWLSQIVFLPLHRFFLLFTLNFDFFSFFFKFLPLS